MVSARIVYLLAVLLPQGAARFVRFENGAGALKEKEYLEFVRFANGVGQQPTSKSKPPEPVVADNVEPEPVVNVEPEPVVADNVEPELTGLAVTDEEAGDEDVDEENTEDTEDDKDADEESTEDTEDDTEEDDEVEDVDDEEFNPELDTPPEEVSPELDTPPEEFNPEVDPPWFAHLKKGNQPDTPPEEVSSSSTPVTPPSTEEEFIPRPRRPLRRPLAQPKLELSTTEVEEVTLSSESEQWKKKKYYVFLEKWKMEGITGAVGGVHTELLFCSSKLFTKDMDEYLRKLSNGAEIKKTWWEKQNVMCQAIYFGGFDKDFVYSYKPGSGQSVYTRRLSEGASKMPGVDSKTVKKFFYKTTKMNAKQLKKKMNDCSDQWRAIDYGSLKHNCNYHTAVALQCQLKKKLSEASVGGLTGLRGLTLSAGECEEMCKDRQPSEEEVRGLERALWLNMEREGADREVSEARYERCSAGTRVHRFKGGSMWDKCKSTFQYTLSPASCDDGSTIYCPHENVRTRCCCPDNTLRVKKSTFGKKRKTCGKDLPAVPTSPAVSDSSVSKPSKTSSWRLPWGKSKVKEEEEDDDEDEDEDEDDIRGTHVEIARSETVHKPDAAAGLLVALVLGLVQ